MSDLKDLDLIDCDLKTRSYRILSELKVILQPSETKHRVNSIFGSPKELEWFEKLSKKHQPNFVFPQIPLSAFIRKEQIQHLFIENLGGWQTASPRFKYFLTARIDFLVCDSEGKPQTAYEYQGGHHKDKDQLEKDEFKRLILKEVGLPLEEITNQDL